MAVEKYKTFVDGEVLTAADLNASFDRIIDNQDDLDNPRTSSLDLDGQRLVIDAAGNVSMIVSTANKLDFRLAGADLVDMDATVATPVNGVSLVASAAGSPVQIKAKGSDANVSILLDPKGSGTVDLDGAILTLDADGDSVLREVSDDFMSLRMQGVDLFTFIGSVASPVTGFNFTAGATGVDPSIGGRGSDAIVNVRLTPKSTGVAACAGGWAVDGATNLTWRWVGSGTSLLLQENTGSASAPTWTTRNTFVTTVGIPGSGLVLLQSYSPSSAASVDITSQISATYDYYLINFFLVPATDAVNLLLRTDAANGASFDSGASDYGYHGVSQNGASTVTGAGSDAASAMTLGSAAGVGNATNEGISGEIIVSYLGSGTRYPHILWNVSQLNASTVHYSTSGSGTRNTAAAINAVQLLFSSGSIASGTVRVYGIRNS